MKALILRQDAQAASAVSRTLMDKGFQILCVEKLDVAHALIRVDTIDLLVMDERIDGQLTHAIALSGERKNPYLSAILLTDRSAEETDDLHALIPALYALAGMSVGTDVLAKLALSAVSNTEDVMARVARQIAVDKAEQRAEEKPEEAAPKPLVLDDIILAEDRAFADEEPSPADIIIAQPEMATIRATRMLTPLERMDDAISAEIAAIFRREGLPVPKTLSRVTPPMRPEAYEVMGGAI
jgi:hypothetical protein